MARSGWRWWPLALLAWPAAELVCLTLLVEAYGPRWVWALVIGTGLLGTVVLISGRRRWRSVTADLRRRDASAAPRSEETTLAGLLEPGRLSDPALTMAAGLLLLLPGPVGDVLGLALLIPGVRALFAASVALRLARRFPQAASGLRSFRIRSGGTVVRGEAVPPETDPGPPPTPPELPPSA